MSWMLRLIVINFYKLLYSGTVVIFIVKLMSS